MQHRRRRDGDLRGSLGGVAEKLEISELDVFDVTNLVDHLHGRRRQMLLAIGAHYGHRELRLHAAELLQEIQVEVLAAELTIGN